MEKLSIYPQNYFNHFKKTQKRQQSLADFGDKTSTPLKFLRPYFWKQFSLNLKSCFLLISSSIYRNMRKLSQKLHYSQNLPPWSPNIFFFFCNFRYNLGYFARNLRLHYQNCLFFSTLSSKMSRNFCKGPPSQC